MRGSDYRGSPSLDRLPTLPPVPSSGASGTNGPDPTAADATEAWSCSLGGVPTLLVSDVDRARALVMTAAGVAPGEAVGLPANATDRLLSAVKRAGAVPRFLALGGDLRPRLPGGRDAPRFAWAQPSAGLAGPAGAWPRAADKRHGRSGGDGAAAGLRCWDLSEGLPPAGAVAETFGSVDVCLWGLHLGDESPRTGALLAFGPGPAARRLRDAVATLLGPEDAPDPAYALARQLAVLAEVRCGLTEAAGLELAPEPSLQLAHGVAVRIPDEVDPATFFAYVAMENTPVRWLPLIRPPHHVALTRSHAEGRATAAVLARWLLLPVGPDFSAEESGHTVLGVVKAAEYLGIRFRTDPRRAAEYAATMEERYGRDHDGYRPAFPVPSPALSTTV